MSYLGRAVDNKARSVSVDLGQGQLTTNKTQCNVGHTKQDAMTDTGQGPYLVALRPTWKKNLFWLLVVAIVLFAIFS